MTGSTHHDAPMTTDAVTTTDPRPAFAQAAATAAEVIAAVRPDQLALPTPCAAFDVRALVEHLLAVPRRVAQVGRGEPLTVPDRITDVAEAEWGRAWADAVHDATAVWAADDLLGTEVQVPWTRLRGADALAIYVSEVLVHAWDLATATGQTPVWDASAVEVAAAAARDQLPAEGRAARFEEARRALPDGVPPFPDPFLAAVEPPADATPIERLVAWNGRDPRPGRA